MKKDLVYYDHQIKNFLEGLQMYRVKAINKFNPFEEINFSCVQHETNIFNDEEIFYIDTFTVRRLRFDEWYFSIK